MVRPLGNRQRIVLRAFARYGGYPDGGWMDTTRSDTERVIHSLVRRGLLDRHEPRNLTEKLAGGRFEINDAGRAALKEAER